MKYLIILTFLLSCSPKYLRAPSSIEQSQLSLLVEDVSKTFVKGLNSSACTVASKEFYKNLFNLTHQSSKFKNISKKKELLTRSFYSRLIIRDYLYEVGKTYEDLDCIKGLRNLVRSLRYLEDYLVGDLVKNKKESPALTGDSPVLLVNPEYSFDDYNDLESGDIIVSRGNAFTSAAIARVGNEDSQFSHVSFVYKDDKGILHTTEAHIEIGSVALKFDAHLAQKNARAIVFRYKDQKLAHKAARHMYLKVKNYSKNNRNNINYDFSMNYKSNTELFCSEVVYDGLQHASMGKVKIPKYKTTFDYKLADFLIKMGINITPRTVHKFDTFGPGDLEFDRRFDLVAEWRDPSKIVNVRVKDAVLTKMFEWMSEEKYRFKPGSKVSAKAYMAYVARRIPKLQSSFIKKFPLNMKIKQMKLFLTLDVIGEVLEKEITSIKNYENLSFNQMYRVLERFKRKDYRLYKKFSSKTKFHQYFRP